MTTNLGPRLEALLTALLAEHREMLALLGEQRRAIRAADARELGRLTEAQRACAGRIADLEQERRRLIAAHAGSLKAAQPTLSNLARLLDEGGRDRCLALAAELRAAMDRLSRESGVVRQAMRSLLSHAQGVMAQVGRGLGASTTYGRRGAFSTLAVGALDLVH